MFKNLIHRTIFDSSLILAVLFCFPGDSPLIRVFAKEEAGSGPNFASALTSATDPEKKIETDDDVGAQTEDGSDEAATEFRPERFLGSSKVDRTDRATPADQFRLLPGYRARLVYSVPIETQGSWVSLALDDQGRLLASDQQEGLYRITIRGDEPVANAPRVERLNAKIGGCQGLLFHHGCLFAVVNGKESGLYRLRDSNGDDQFDEVRLLRKFDGEGEHGPHAVVADPDGNSLVIVGGNGCFPGDRIERSRVPRVWLEDRLLNRTSASDGPWEPPKNRIGGWVVRTDLEGREFELIAMGLRNPYDVAFDRTGELFTFDADMEWDTGTPWYRPTRINHIISGADFGWRAGTAKWPDHFFDSFGSVVDIGLSSPTGLVFGYGTRFPQRYQRALFACDWSLGNIYAVHLTPDGATFAGEVEPFVVGAPLPVTDVVINPHDGAMYFIVGGRGITSALYRVTYDGEQVPPPAAVTNVEDDPIRPAVSLRRRLESFHVASVRPELTDIWPHLGDEDRAIRFAARIALEHQPRQRWRAACVTETDARRRIAASLALARHADENDLPLLRAAIEKTDWAELTTTDRNDFVRLMTVVIDRHGSRGAPGRRLRDFAAKRLGPVFPTGSEMLDRQLAEILAIADGPAVIEPILDALDTAATQETQIHYAMCLRDIDEGWTVERRKRLLEWFQRTASQRGGVLFGSYLQQLHGEVLKQLGEEDQKQLADLLELPQPTDPYQELESRPVVRRWTIREVLDKLSVHDGDVSVSRGQDVFRTALCYRCHRVHGQGGMVGPDLSTVGRRFNIRDMMESIIEPSKVISDQYRAVQILTDDGRQLTGKVTDMSGNSLVIMNNVLDQADLATIKRDRIEEMSWSTTSTMPVGLLDTFTLPEIADLHAFLTDAANVATRRGTSNQENKQ